uniref:Uncharacterized protein n=1 Tax=Burkholderia orbicola (strain AU 1054) TaxID=331271 RepID=A0A0H2XVZ2_BURO1
MPSRTAPCASDAWHAGIVKGRDSGEFGGAPIRLDDGRSTMMAPDNASDHGRDGGTCRSIGIIECQAFNFLLLG